MIQVVIMSSPNPNPFDFRLVNLEQIEHFAELVAEFVRKEDQECQNLSS
jgi:hypothetical protein